jgi:Bacterial capsule synthesis protein PGA_cap
VQRRLGPSAIFLLIAIVAGGSCGGTGTTPMAKAVQPVADSVPPAPPPEIGPPSAPATPPGADTAGTDTAPGVETDEGVPHSADANQRPPRDIRVCAGGDVMLGNNLDTLWARRSAARLGEPVPPQPDPDSLLAPLRPLLVDADIVLLNVEGAIGEGPAPPKCRPGSTRCYAFRQNVDAAFALGRFADPAAVVGNVANNHAMDAGLSGFQSTIGNLERAGVRVTGADTLPTVVATHQGDTVAFLGFSTAQAGPDPRDLNSVRRHVARAAGRFARLVVTAHMGAEGAAAQRTRNETEQYLGENRGNVVAFAKAAIAAGASTVFIHGPHVLRAVERQGGAVIFYSLGNLLTYGPFNLSEPLNRGALACVLLDPEGRVSEAALRSTWQRPPGRVAPDVTARAVTLVDSLSRLDFPAGRLEWLSEAVARQKSPRDSLRR